MGIRIRCIGLAVALLAMPAMAAPVLLTDFNGTGNSDWGWQEATYGGSDDFLYHGEEMYQGRYDSYDRGGAVWPGGAAHRWVPAAGESVEYDFWNISDSNTSGYTVNRIGTRVRIRFYDFATSSNVEAQYTYDHPDYALGIGEHITIGLPLVNLDGLAATDGSGKQFTLGTDTIDNFYVYVFQDNQTRITGPISGQPNLGIDNLRVVPEPGTLLLLACAAAGALRRRLR